MTEKEIKGFIQREMFRQGISRNQLCVKAGLSRSSMANWFNEDWRSINMCTFERLCDALGLMIVVKKVGD